jgi:nucleoside diphosphate kinase
MLDYIKVITLCYTTLSIHLQQVRDIIAQNNFYVVRSKELRWTVADAQNFYSEHKGINHLVNMHRPITAPSIILLFVIYGPNIMQENSFTIVL